MIDFIIKYGCLYVWSDAMKVCPDGWKLPSKKDYEILSLIADNDYINEKISTRLRAKTIFEQLPFSDVETGITITDGTEKTDCEELDAVALEGGMLA